MKIKIVVDDQELVDMSEFEFRKISDAFNSLVLLCRNNQLVTSLLSRRDRAKAALIVEIGTAQEYESSLVAFQTIFPGLSEINRFIK